MANRDYKKIKRVIKDFSQNVGGASVSNDLPFIDLPLTIKETGLIDLDRQDCEYSGDLEKMLKDKRETTGEVFICVHAHVVDKNHPEFEGDYMMCFMSYTENIMYPISVDSNSIHRGNSKGKIGALMSVKFDIETLQFYEGKDQWIG